MFNDNIWKALVESEVPLFAVIRKMAIPKLPTLIEEADWHGYEIDEVRNFFRKIGKLKVITWDKWFAGQTGGISKDGKFCVYKGDFDRFCYQQGIRTK